MVHRGGHQLVHRGGHQLVHRGIYQFVHTLLTGGPPFGTYPVITYIPFCTYPKQSK